MKGWFSMLNIDVLRIAKYNQMFDPSIQNPERHSHTDYYQLYFRLSGKAYVSCGDDNKILSETNEVMLAQPNIPHQFKLIHNHKGPLMVFDCKFKSNDKKLDEVLNKLPHFIRHNCEPIFIKLVENSIEEAEFKKPFYKQQIDSNIATMLIALIRSIDNNYRNTSDPYNTFFISETESFIKGIDINLLLEYIDAHITDMISLDDLSLYVKMNKTTLIEIFKIRFGVTPIRFITLRKIDKAKKLLMDDSLRIGYISDYIGFRSMQYFCSVFKKETGISPLEYRNRKSGEYSYTWGKT